VIRIENQYRLNSKIKNEMKAKVNLVEDKPKCKNMNLSGKKFKISITLILSLNPKPLAISLMGSSAMSLGEQTIWLCSSMLSPEGKNHSNLLQKKTKETSRTKSTW